MALVTLFAMSAAIYAQIALPGSGIINTIGGTAFPSGNGGPATSAGLNMPSGSAVDSSGNLYFADTYNNIVHKVTVTTGIITTVAGNGITGFSGDSGAATSAELNSPSAVAVDSAGNLYVADWGNCRIRKVTASTGVITTVAGNGTCGYAGDGGAAASAHLNGPYGVAVDSAGNLYIADTGNNRIRKVLAASGVISTVAGNGTAGAFGDGGAATSAEVNQPWGVAVDSSSNILVADTSNNRIRKVTVATGIITTIAGNGTAGYSGDGASATSAELNFPTHTAIDSSGNIYIADGDNYRIRKLTISSGIITTVAGNGTYGYSGDGGVATSAGMWIPEGVAVDSSGNVYLSDSGNDRIRKVTAATGIINTIAGDGLPGAYSGDGGPATSATFNASAVAVDSARNVYIADYDNQCIRKLTASTGAISTVAGDGTLGYSGNGGEATSAELAWPAGVAVDSAGNIYIADSGNSVIRKVTVSTGIISTVAGSGVAGFSGNGGAATSAKLSDPQGVAVDSSGNVYIADAGNSVIWKVTASTGIINVIAGTGTYGYSGNGGPATSAQIGYPQGIAVDTASNVYFADPGNIVVQKITASSGVISTVAGNTVYGFSGDGGAATSAELGYPQAIAVDSAGNFYIADGSENRIRKVTVSTGVISTVAGVALAGFSGDGGAAASAELSGPDGVAVDSDGDIYIADGLNYRIRVIGGPKGTLAISVASSGSPSIYGASVTFTATIGGGATGSITFYDGAASIGSGTISGTTASFATAALAAGSHSITATWPGNTSYNSITSAGITQVVNKVTPTITWSNPAAITTATPLTSTQLNATASVAGTFSYSPAAGALLAAGTQILSVTFTPTNTTDYNTATASVSVVVTQASVGGIITTVAGNGTAGFSGDGGAATSAELSSPSALVFDGSGNLYIADKANYRIRRVAGTTAVISTIAGNGTFGGYSTTGYHTQAWAGNGGPATSVPFGSLSGVATDSAGNVYLSDADYGDVRKVTISTGLINTVAGYGMDGYCGTNCGNGGPATSAYLYNVNGVAVDGSGNLYIADSTNYVIWKVTASTGIINLIAGTGYEGPSGSGGGFSGDGGPALDAEIGSVSGIALDAAGNIYISDESNARIRKITASTGVITTIAGNGNSGFSGDGGQAVSAEIYDPVGLAVDHAGNVYFADSFNNRIRKVVAATGVISTVAGNGTYGSSGDGGPATSAELGLPQGVALDSAGNLYIADYSNQKIRKVTPSTATPILTWLAPSPISYGAALSTTQLNATANVPGTFAYTPASGTVLKAGSYSLSVTFTPTDTTDYSSVTLTVPLTVNQATPTISWAPPADVPYGTALGSGQLDASSTVAGTLVYSPGAGTVLPIGPHTLTVTLYPADTVDYTAAYASAFLTVSQVTGTWDSGTVTLIVNGSTVASTSYGQGSTPSTVAAGLATSTIAGSSVYVSSVDDALYLEAKTGGSATDYSYSLQTTSWNHNFAHPSFVYPTITGKLDGGSNQTTGTATVYSYSVPNTGYDGVGNLKNITDSVMGTWTFNYDTLNRVTEATDTQTGNPNTHYCWAYDAFGNRTIQAGSSAAFAVGSPVSSGTTPCQPASGASFTSTWANYNTTANNNRITNTSLATGGMIYDATGDVTNDGVNQYLYDAEGRICAVANTVSGSTTLTGYIYNGDGIRVAKGSITEWNCDPTINGFRTINDYILGAANEQVTEIGMDANGTLAWQHTNVWADGRLIATYDNDGLHFYFNDLLGTRRAQTDYTGVVEQNCASLPYGDSLSCTNSTQYPTEHHFTGKERDAESGNDYFEARYYSSAMGRFLSPDWSATEEPVPYAQLDDPQSLNLYSYVRNNPLTRVDADGHCVEDLCIGEGIALYALGTAAVVATETWLRSPSGQAAVERASETLNRVGEKLSDVLHQEAKPVPNPDGQQGAPDHQAKVKEEADKARAQAGPGETVLEGKKIQGHDSTRRPDVQTVGTDGKTKSVVEVERRPNSARHKARQAEYDQLGVQHKTVPLPPKPKPGQN